MLLRDGGGDGIGFGGRLALVVVFLLRPGEERAGLVRVQSLIVRLGVSLKLLISAHGLVRTTIRVQASILRRGPLRRGGGRRPQLAVRVLVASVVCVARAGVVLVLPPSARKRFRHIDFISLLPWDLHSPARLALTFLTTITIFHTVTVSS